MLLETMLAIGMTAAIATGLIVMIGPENAAALGTLLKFVGMGLGLIATALAICGLLWLATRPLAALRRRRATGRADEAEAAAARQREADAAEQKTAAAPAELMQATTDPELRAALVDLIDETARWRANSEAMGSTFRRAGRHLLWGIGTGCRQMLDRPALLASGEARAQLATSVRHATARLRVGPDRIENSQIVDFKLGLRILDQQVVAQEAPSLSLDKGAASGFCRDLALETKA